MGEDEAAPGWRPGRDRQGRTCRVLGRRCRPLLVVQSPSLFSVSGNIPHPSLGALSRAACSCHTHACMHTCAHRGSWAYTHTHTHTHLPLPLSSTRLLRQKRPGLTCVLGKGTGPPPPPHTFHNVLGLNHTNSCFHDSLGVRRTPIWLPSPQGLLTGRPGGPGWPASPFGPVGPWGKREENQPWSLRPDVT